MRVANFLHPDSIVLDMKATTKAQALDELIDALMASGRVTDREKIRTAVIEREELFSTGFENGVAIPHPRQGQPAIVKEIISAFGRSSKGIDFESMDGEPVKIFFMLCAPSDGEHLRALARLSRLLKEKSFRDELMAATNAEDVIEAVATEEAKLAL
jgi:fructose-specific phosphotransferase system IIA component